MKRELYRLPFSFYNELVPCGACPIGDTLCGGISCGDVPCGGISDRGLSLGHETGRTASAQEGMSKMDIDVIIPVYKPDQSIFTLIRKLEGQTVPPRTILLMNTEEKYFQNLVYGTQFLKEHRNVEVRHLSKREFDHGRTRREAVKRCQSEIFVMMTQDAMPVDDRLLERLAAGLGPGVAVAYARQLPKDDCGEIERYTRQFNYPDKSRVKSYQDLEELGIKTFFCSNVCAAYRRDIYEELGGFVRHTIFNEDMIYASGAIRKGYKIAYVAEAEVVHSHHYTNGQQFRRNFDLGVSQADHPEVFEDVPSESEGVRMVLQTARHLLRKGKAGEIFRLFSQSVCKYAGYFLGKRYRKLPRKWILAFTDNKDYWQQ